MVKNDYMGLYLVKEIQVVHLEISSRCNARCPMCGRNAQGGSVHPHLQMCDLSAEDVRRILPPAFVRQLRRIFLCGNFGDPSMAAEGLEILDYLRSQQPELKLGMHTNGGARDEAYWRNLASRVTYCRFGIDGLEDTNHLYRQGVKWDRLRRNVQAFVGAGGVAEWDFLVFRHNQQQVEQAAATAREWGFKQFSVKSTSRFFSVKQSQMRDRVAVFNSKDELSHHLQPTTREDMQNDFLRTQKALLDKYGDFVNYWNQVPIYCKVQKEKSVYVAATGHILPCCWLGGELNGPKPNLSSLDALLARLPLKSEALNAHRQTLAQIVEGDFFQTLLPQSWREPSLSEGKLQTCARICGVEAQPFESQFL